MKSCSEVISDGDEECMLSAVDKNFSGPFGEAPDIPGKRMAPPPRSASETWPFWRRAADPSPRSGVCLNHVGSFVASDCAICVRDGAFVSVFPTLGSLTAKLEALSWTATDESGRLIGPVEPLEVGLCCHDNVPPRESAFVDVDGEGEPSGFCPKVGRLLSGSVVSRCGSMERGATPAGL
jgi:hypothetical protein